VAQPSPGAGGFAAQLSALRSLPLAGETAARLRAAHPDLLRGRGLTVTRMDLGARGIFHGVRTGPLDGKGGAEALCARFKARGQDCIVVRLTGPA
jgi:hypothetical protein